MSLHEYRASKEIGLLDPPFYAIIMAAMRGADTRNADLLRRAFPETWDELQARYNAPGGLLPGESVAPSDAVLGHCPHGVNLDREFCKDGCRV